jgi:hypothetical protein
MKFVPAQIDAKVVLIAAPQPKSSTSSSCVSDPMGYFDLNSLPLLLPEESHACTFSVTKEVGSLVRSFGIPEIKWCSYMGEHGIVKGNMVQLESNIQPNIMYPTDGQIHIDCMRSPSSSMIGIDFEVTLRITNNTLKQLPLQLICRDAVCSSFSSTSALMTEVPSSNLESSSSAGNVGTGAQTGIYINI